MLSNKIIGQGLYAISLGVVAYIGLRLYRPNYSSFYGLSKVHRI